MKKNIAVFFGGVSCEHDISVITGVQALNSLGDKFNVFPVYIFSDGKWYYDNALKKISIYKNFELIKNKFSCVTFTPSSNVLYKIKGKRLKALTEIDCAVVAMHGLNGEDGSLAGLLQLSGVPYTSSSLLGSAVGMDKIAMKTFFSGLGLNILPYCFITRQEYMEKSTKTILHIESKLNYPIIVKPSMLGSSIGINKCRNRNQLIEAIEIAIRFDRRILLEKAEEEFIEINCAAFKESGEIKVSECERPVNWKDFLKFEDKYLNDAKGMAGLKKVFPADIDKQLSDEVKKITKNIYQNLDLKGVVRADYIISDKIYINEINTIPGSLSYYLWEYDKIKYSDLLEILIKEAIADYKDLMRCTFSFKSDVLSFGGNKDKKIK